MFYMILMILSQIACLNTPSGTRVQVSKQTHLSHFPYSTQWISGNERMAKPLEIH